MNAKQLGHATSGSSTDKSYHFQLLHSLEDLLRMSGHTVNGEVHAQLGRNAIVPSSPDSGFQVSCLPAACALMKVACCLKCSIYIYFVLNQ